MKLIVLSALLAVAAAGHFNDYYAVPDYSTAYSVKDPYSGVKVDKQENRLGDKTEGSYSQVLPDGRLQVVRYWVDGYSGYNADVQYYGAAKHPHTPIHHGYGNAGYVYH
ncbi:cuticle protein 19-like [Pollicipes pollicipes]|uniref:cuticle protein 19-like n=1 Tax=Pollicipes pollicipes TaxID=41117 RepID=UPI0018852A7C|nr:cuticle protein 19-like [Pollicipes pollicipes]XP_037069625.1 cuticle protein 19-like [Pollicipes pollicipes]XP_037071849.1 cuticle protein 19-like [Pollicipes pollicipes]